MAPVVASRGKAKARAHTAVDWSPQTLTLAAELARDGRPLKTETLAGLTVEARASSDSLWLIIRTPGNSSVALRTAHSPGGGLTTKAADPGRFAVDTPIGDFVVHAQPLQEGLLRVTVTLTPAAPLAVPFWPRDLYPLGPNDDPTLAVGEVIAAQRGLNAPVVFARLDGAIRASLLYFQNLTALNAWFAATQTKPDGVVGGRWPELGYQPPAAPLAPSPPTHAVPAGKPLILSDVFLRLCDVPDAGEAAEATAFLEGMAAIYPHLDRPATRFRDWPGMAAATIQSLSRSPQTHVERYGHTYLRPYTGAEVPDSMVQLTVLGTLSRYGRWRGRPAPLEARLRGGVARFFDPELKALRRYLPNVAAGTEPIEKAREKDFNQVDSWYLYHPLSNLGRLALAGDEDARTLFLASLGYAISAAHHFKYAWPVLFDVKTWTVDQKDREEAGDKGPRHGQTDVGGLYAYVMLQAHELTGDVGYLREAKAGLKALQGLRFELLYQANITAWGAAACARLWRLTGDPQWSARMLPLLASFFHNTIFWESELEAASAYQTFLAATCLHDGPYMAIYECHESFAAFREILSVLGDDAPPAVRLLLAEYSRMALSRAWSFYPSELPVTALAPSNRNGHIARDLALPLEDLYADGQPAGQVGQEVYGCGAAFTFTSEAFYRLPDGSTLFCDYPLHDLTVGEGDIRAQIAGWPQGQCRLRLLGAPKRVRATAGGEPLQGRHHNGAWEAAAPGAGPLVIRYG